MADTSFKSRAIGLVIVKGNWLGKDNIIDKPTKEKQSTRGWQLMECINKGKVRKRWGLPSDG
ncbi:unnamed protein product [Sphenostylis stenocarpa]|uniref:Uncharacterized protein n=1 Tax=Sphenostylis stenocarpa TaxID=92480 RepID=A0AA86VEE6_9FABA|nr:unnamed protein product [Sphenostylis stenocarpa]